MPIRNRRKPPPSNAAAEAGETNALTNRARHLSQRGAAAQVQRVKLTERPNGVGQCSEAAEAVEVERFELYILRDGRLGNAHNLGFCLLTEQLRHSGAIERR